MIARRKWQGAGLTGLLLIAAGCSGNDTPAHVEGVVTLDNKPVPAALVTFYSQTSPRIASGRTDGEGSFTLDEPLAPGRYKVTVIPWPPGGGPPVGADPTDPTKAMALTKAAGPPKKDTRPPRIPAAYATIEDTPLEEEVTAEGKITIALRSDVPPPKVREMPDPSMRPDLGGMKGKAPGAGPAPKNEAKKKASADQSPGPAGTNK
jgi:hypothetical protein